MFSVGKINNDKTCREKELHVYPERKSRQVFLSLSVSLSLSFSFVLGILLINWIRPTPDELYELSGSGLYFGPTLI